MSLKNKIDTKLLGFVLGIIFPIIAFLIYWQWKYAEKDWEQLMYFVKLNSDNRNNILVFSLLPNLVLFYFTNFQFRLDKMTTGLVAATLLLAIPIVISLAL